MGCWRERVVVWVDLKLGFKVGARRLGFYGSETRISGRRLKALGFWSNSFLLWFIYGTLELDIHQTRKETQGDTTSRHSTFGYQRLGTTIDSENSGIYHNAYHTQHLHRQASQTQAGEKKILV